MRSTCGAGSIAIRQNRLLTRFASRAPVGSRPDSTATILRGRCGPSAQNGAHERNRTADLLLTMQMLYRLSYVGASSGLQAGSTALWMSLDLEYCHRKSRRGFVLAREDATSPRDLRNPEVVREECEPGNLVPGYSECQRKTRKNSGLRLRTRGIRSAAAARSPANLERETGFEPATLSLEG